MQLDILLLWILCLLISVEDTCSGIFTRNLINSICADMYRVWVCVCLCLGRCVCVSVCVFLCVCVCFLTN